MRIRCGVGVVVALLLFASDAWSKDCELLNVYLPDEFKKGRSIAIQPFAVTTAADAEREELGQFAARQLETKLHRTTYFSAVKVMDDAGGSPVDFVVEGAIGDVDHGNRVLRAAFGSGAATAELQGVVRLGSGEVVADFECFRRDVGGALGAGGWVALFQSGTGRVRKNLEKFADALAKSFPTTEKLWADRRGAGKKKLDPIVGSSEPAPSDWHAKNVSTWTPEDHLSEVVRFAVTTDRSDWYQAQALWLTASSYRSHTLLLEAIANGEHAPLEPSDLGRGLLPDLTAVRALEDRGLIVFAVRFERPLDRGVPFFWNGESLRGRTYIVDAQRPEQKIFPAEVIHLPTDVVKHRVRLNPGLPFRSHPVVFAFPLTTPDGSRWLNQADQVISIHSEINGREVRVTFTLSDFGLQNVSSLSLVKQ